jgi:hypothetical protein
MATYKRAYPATEGCRTTQANPDSFRATGPNFLFAQARLTLKTMKAKRTDPQDHPLRPGGLSPSPSGFPLEDYDIAVARYLVQGVDVWLNTPRRPMEASGTSGMKVLPNGGLNLSILDGWWCERIRPDDRMGDRLW